MTLTKITTGGITDATIATADIAADAITGAKIADDAVGAEHIEVLDADLQMTDAGKIKLGTGNDLEIFHNGTSNIIEATNGDLNIRMNNSENAIVARQNGAAELYHNNVKKFETTSDGIESDSELHFKAPSSTTGEQVGRIEWWNESDAGVMAKIAVDRTAATAAPTDLVFSTSANIDTTANGGDGDITERMRIDSNGDVIIGTTSWSYKKPLNVQGSSGSILALSNYDTTTYAADTNTSIELRVNTGDTGNQNGSCEIRAFKENGTNGNNARGLSFYTAPNGSSPAEAMRIASDGNALFHTTTNDNTIAGAGGIQLSDDANGSFIRISKKNTYAVPAMEFHNPNGRVGQIIPSGTSTSYSTSGSDRSLKKNFESWSEDVLTLFKNINPQKFNFIQEEDGAEKTKGFIAQEITDSFPEAYIKGFGEDEKYMFNPSGMVVYLMKAIQDLNAKVEALEAA